MGGEWFSPPHPSSPTTTSANKWKLRASSFRDSARQGGMLHPTYYSAPFAGPRQLRASRDGAGHPRHPLLTRGLRPALPGLPPHAPLCFAPPPTHPSGLHTHRTHQCHAHTPPLYPPCRPYLPAQGFLDGIGAELQASEAQELEEGEMRERVHQALTRK